MKIFDRTKLRLKPLSAREHNLDLSAISPLTPVGESPMDENIEAIADRVLQAKKKGASIILMIGAHVLRSGVQRYLIDLMERRVVGCIATNGASVVHDFEFALIGATTESVARYVKSGQFGLWRETGRINEVINRAYAEDGTVGMGEAVGRHIEDGNFPHKDISVFAAAYRLGVPMTVHVGIGYDIVHEHPNCNGAATGALSYNDFLRFAAVVEGLDGGVVMNFGSAVMGPEIFLKALSMARNEALTEGHEIRRFSVLVCDLAQLPDDVGTEPSKTEPFYYFRPWKTLLVRTVADGGESFYVRGSHEETIPRLWTAIARMEEKIGKGD